MVGSQEFYDLIAMFDREFGSFRLDKEVKEMWPKGYIYQQGEVNNLFIAYRKGFAFGKATSQ
jgi:hypothetical protein